MTIKKELQNLKIFFRIFREAMAEKSSIFTKMQIIFMLFLWIGMIVFFFYNLPSTITWLISIAANSALLVFLFIISAIFCYFYFCIIWLPERGYKNLGFFLFVPGGAILVAIIAGFF